MHAPTPDELVTKIAGAAMAELVATPDRHGTYISERVSIDDLWKIALVTARIATMTTGGPEAIARTSPDVLNYIDTGKKIQAIKEVRSLTSLSLKEAKDLVEKIAEERGR